MENCKTQRLKYESPLLTEIDLLEEFAKGYLPEEPPGPGPAGNGETGETPPPSEGFPNPGGPPGP